MHLSLWWGLIGLDRGLAVVRVALGNVHYAAATSASLVVPHRLDEVGLLLLLLLNDLVLLLLQQRLGLVGGHFQRQGLTSHLDPLENVLHLAGGELLPHRSHGRTEQCPEIYKASVINENLANVMTEKVGRISMVCSISAWS